MTGQISMRIEVPHEEIGWFREWIKTTRVRHGPWKKGYRFYHVALYESPALILLEMVAETKGIRIWRYATD
jgi:hypothetical protein